MKNMPRLGNKEKAIISSYVSLFDPAMVSDCFRRSGHFHTGGGPHTSNSKHRLCGELLDRLLLW